MIRSRDSQWPELPYAAWRDTRDTLHLWTQIVGKIRLMQTPWLNHSWHVTLYVTSRGLTTSPIVHGSRVFEVEFDFLSHALIVTVSDGNARRLPLRQQSVSDFYGALMAALTELGVAVVINDRPCEIPGAATFTQDRQHAAYDPEYARRFWQVLVQTDRVFKRFRTAFIGKSSPVRPLRTGIVVSSNASWGARKSRVTCDARSTSAPVGPSIA